MRGCIRFCSFAVEMRLFRALGIRCSVVEEATRVFPTTYLEQINLPLVNLGIIL